MGVTQCWRSVLLTSREFKLSVLRIRNVYPGSWFYPSRIPDLGSNNNNKREGGNICCLTFLSSHTYRKKYKLFYFETGTGKNRADWQRILVLVTFNPKKFHQGLRNMGEGLRIRNPRSGSREKPIRDPGKTYPRSQIQGLNKHRIPEPQHCKTGINLSFHDDSLPGRRSAFF